MRCSKCGTDNRETAKYCDGCGAPLALHCPSCGSTARTTARFCESCGSAFQLDSGPIQQPSDPLPEGERKIVTALFADIKGSTELMRDIDPEEAQSILDPALRLMGEAVQQYGGYVVQSTGDGVFAIFGAPAAYEDHPQRALYAAIRMQQYLGEHSQRLVNQGKPPLEARFGINTGEVVVRTVQTRGRVEYTPIGHTANLAARLQTLAPPGSIAVSDHTRRLVEGYFELRALGPAQVRGISEPINVHEVTGLGPLRTHFQLSARRGLTKFVGRERELEQMRHALDLTISGQGQLVAVVAEASTGKSRLFHEFKATLPPGCKVLEAYSVSHGKASAWLPVLELVRGYVGIEEVDVPASGREKIHARIAALDPPISDVVPYLWRLIGIQEGPDPLAQMDPQICRQRTLDGIKRIVLGESLNQPTVVIFEDLHWTDSETQALLDLLADSIVNSRILLLVNYRPEYRHEWSGRTHYVQLRLDPLFGETAAAMLEALLSSGADLDPLKRLIAERTSGNPFFMEEMVQALFEQRILERNGEVKLVRPLSQARIPVTVQGVIAARIDRLTTKDKRLLQMLAVIGNEFPLAVAKQVTQMSDKDLKRGLANLRLGEFVYERPALAEVHYAFKHALTHEVAYNSLLIERRKQLHERVGQALESMSPGRLEEHLIELAHHYSHSDDGGKAVEYLGRAGVQARNRYALADAITNFTSAIDLVQKQPDSAENLHRESILQLSLGGALILVKGEAAAKVEQAFARARELCEQLDDSRRLFQSLTGLWAVHLYRGELAKAYQLAQQLWQLAQNGNKRRVMFARILLGQTLYSMGELRRAREEFEEVVHLYDFERHSKLLPGNLGDIIGDDIGVWALSLVANTLWMLGYPDQALKKGNEAMTLAQATSRMYDLVFASLNNCGLRLLRREPEAAQEVAEQIIGTLAKYGLRDVLPATRAYLGRALAQQGKLEKGISDIQESLATARAAGMGLLRRYALCSLAEVFISADRLNDALSALTEAESAADQLAHCGEPLWTEVPQLLQPADIYRLKGEVLLRQNDFNGDEVQNCFQRAIEIARMQSAKSWELRAKMSLARLLAKQGRRDHARTMLIEIYNWFTEGFDTADLKEAKALLDELSR